MALAREQQLLLLLLVLLLLDTTTLLLLLLALLVLEKSSTTRVRYRNASELVIAVLSATPRLCSSGGSISGSIRGSGKW